MKKSIFAARLNYIESLLIDLRKANLTVLRASLQASNPWNYLHSYAQVARFLQCDPKTAAHLIEDGLIRYNLLNGEISVFIPDILEAAAKYDRVGRLIARIRTGRDAKYCVSTDAPPKITIETELYPGRFIFATIKYQGWRCNACIPYHLWNDPEKVTDFVEQIIRARNEKVPFRIPPAICPGGVSC